MLNNNNLIATIMSMFIFMIFVFTNNNKLNKKLNNLEKFNTNDMAELDSKIEQKINSFYNMDIEAIRNLGAIAKSIMTSSKDDPDGVITLPGNVEIVGNLTVQKGLDIKATGVDNALYIHKGTIYITGKDSRQRSIHITSTGGEILIEGKKMSTHDSITPHGGTAITIPEGGGYCKFFGSCKPKTRRDDDGNLEDKSSSWNNVGMIMDKKMLLQGGIDSQSGLLIQKGSLTINSESGLEIQKGSLRINSESGLEIQKGSLRINSESGLEIQKGCLTIKSNVDNRSIVIDKYNENGTGGGEIYTQGHSGTGTAFKVGGDFGPKITTDGYLHCKYASISDSITGNILYKTDTADAPSGNLDEDIGFSISNCIKFYLKNKDKEGIARRNLYVIGTTDKWNLAEPEKNTFTHVYNI